ncbi:MAG: rubrerythrin [Tissierellia bacterium]|nr:rubrerythrin [Tissierellia bacterium]
MQEILDGILHAIEDEIQSQKHYQILSEKADDPKVKKFFQQLKIDEENHEKSLRTRYEAFKKLSKANIKKVGDESKDN